MRYLWQGEFEINSRSARYRRAEVHTEVKG